MGTADTSPSTDHSQSGVIPRIMHDLFSRISDNTETSYRIKATYLEVCTTPAYMYVSKMHDAQWGTILLVKSEVFKITLNQFNLVDGLKLSSELF